jgi:hypothetical protein
MPLNESFWAAIAVAMVLTIPVCVFFAVKRHLSGERGSALFKYFLLLPIGAGVTLLIFILFPLLEVLALALDVIGFGFHVVELFIWIRDKFVGF